MEKIICNRCGSEVSSDPKKVSDGYKFYCPCCDEDLFEFETHKESKHHNKLSDFSKI